VGRRDVSSVRAGLILRREQQCERVRCGECRLPRKWLHAFIRQIFFRKECARMDSRARSREGTAQYRLELSEQLFPGFRTLVLEG
jgi:hypothetical protein